VEFPRVADPPATLLFLQHGGIGAMSLQSIADQCLDRGGIGSRSDRRQVAHQVDVELVTGDRLVRGAHRDRPLRINRGDLEKRRLALGQPGAHGLVPISRRLVLVVGEVDLREQRVESVDK
jgi:hypothetical protein